MSGKSMFKITLLAISLLIISTYNLKAESGLTADEIIKRSEDVYPGKDQKSKLTFLIKESNGTERKVILRRYWKRYDKIKGNLESKVLVFNEYPPESLGSSFMVTSYKMGSGKNDDQWLYIPILKKPQKLPEPVQELFGESSLKPADMARREPELDTNKLLREETIENKEYYVVESTPKKKDPNYDYGKVIKWITKDLFLKEKMEYYDLDGKPLKEQFATWKKIANAWVWEKVLIKNLQTSAQIVLSVNDIEIDLGLSDDLFSEKSMIKGINSIK